MRRVIKNKKKMKNTMFIVFGVYSLVLFGITNLNPSYASEGILLDSVVESVVSMDLGNNSSSDSEVVTETTEETVIADENSGDITEEGTVEDAIEITEGDTADEDIEASDIDELDLVEGGEVVDEETVVEEESGEGISEENNEESEVVKTVDVEAINIEENSVEESINVDESDKGDEVNNPVEEQQGSNTSSTYSTSSTSSGGGSNSVKSAKEEDQPIVSEQVVEEVVQPEIKEEESVENQVELQREEQPKTELEIAWETLNDKEIDGTYTYNGVTVNVKAPVGSFPKDVKLVITPMKGDELDAAQKKVSNNDMTVFDISFMYTFKDGSKIELEPLEGKNVQVSFNYEKNEKLSNAAKKGQKLKVYHIGEEAEEMRIDSNDKGELTVNVNKFSPYGIAPMRGGEGGGTTATLLHGTGFNEMVKTLAKGSTVSYLSSDSLIEKIKKSDEPVPESGYRTGLVSTIDSEEEIVAWRDEISKTIYYYTDADIIYMNEDSSYMFSSLRVLTSLDLSSWDTSNVTNMSSMFSTCHNLISLNLSGWDTSNVTNMSTMFSFCRSLTSLDLSSWDTSIVTNMQNMFGSCESLTSLNLSGWDTSNVTNIYNMFGGCSGLTSLDLSSWDTSNVTTMMGMFAASSMLKTIYVSDKFNLDNVSESEDMFTGATSLVGGNGTTYDSTKTDKEYARIDREGEPGYFTERNLYTITFNTSAKYLRDADGNIPESNTIVYEIGDDVTLYTNLKEGYAFNGWDVDTSNSSGTWLNISDTITDMHIGTGHTGNVLLRYNSTPGVYQLILDDTDCEISDTSLTVIYGKSLNATGTTLSGADTLPIPTKTGYTFQGYSKESGSTSLLIKYKNNKVSPSIKFNDGNFIIDHENKTSTIYPVFNENKYTVVYFDSMSGNSSATGIAYGTTIVLEERVNTGDYTFKGWYTEEIGGSYVGMGGDSYTITSEATLIKLYARWAKAKIESLTGDITYTDTNGKVFTGIGTITVMVGDDSITMLDRNLGATSNDIDSEDSYGYLFQWGNNYGFSRDEELNVSSTALQATNYSWNNPYVSGNFIAAGNKYWDTSYNGDLWGGTGDYNNERGIDTSDSGYARQGPCPAGYHVPSIGEMDELMRMFKSITGGNAQLQTGANGNLVESNPFTLAFTTELHFPIAGYIGWDGAFTGVSETAYSYSYFWSSSFKKANGYFMISHHPQTSKKDKVSSRGNSLQQGNALSIRCFKDTAAEGEEITLSYDTRDGSAMQAQTLPLGGTGYLPGYTTHRDNAELVGWYYEDLLTEFDLENTSINEDTTIYAKWSDDYIVKFYDYDGTLLKTELVRGGNAATAPTVSDREGYTFNGWDVEFSNVSSDLDITAQWSINQYTLTIDTDGGDEIAPMQIDYGTALIAPKVNKKYYHFIGWSPEFPETMPAHDVTVKALWEENGRSGAGHRNTLREADTDDQHNSAEDKESSNNQSEQNNESKVLELDMEKYNPNYPLEFNEAYQFSYNNKITTVETIKATKMYTPLTRIQMAKMLSYYAMNVLGQKPDDTLYVSFKDVSDKLDAQYDNGVTLAYQLGIMGINMPNNKFRPNDKVTRAEFATALSRMVYGIDDGRGRVKYYEPHIAKLYNEGVISNTNPKMIELRGYVMLMLMRTVSK